MCEPPGNEGNSEFLFTSTALASDKTELFNQLQLFGPSAGWSSAIQNEIELILEEWWTNLVSYALAGNDHPRVTVAITSTGQDALLDLRDNGIPFDPTAQPDPDLTLHIEERPIGGLGIYMMKKLSDRISSQRLHGENILRIEKSLLRPVLVAKK